MKLAYGELLDALMQSYSQLIQFARRNNISESINPEDIGMSSPASSMRPSRALPGKVQRINLKIAPDLQRTESKLLIQVPPGSYQPRRLVSLQAFAGVRPTS